MSFRVWRKRFAQCRNASVATPTITIFASMLPKRSSRCENVISSAGRTNPVSTISTGISNAVMTPPAENSDQKNGSLE